MIIKKFQAKTETEAIMRAKEEMGKEAIVMNIKTITPKGIYKLFRKPTVEITAAIDDNGSTEKLPSTDTGLLKKDQGKEAKLKALENTSFKSNPNIIYDNFDSKESETSISYLTQGYLNSPNDTSAIEKKLNNLQDLLEKQLKEKNDEENSTVKTDDKQENLTFIQLIYNQLIRNEVDEIFVNQIISEIESKITKDSTLDNILSSVYQKIILKLGQPKTIELIENQQKLIFFIGPTGVGKTTTIAKIASTLKLNQKAKIAMLTSDTYRIAAVEQLRTYANILGIPMKVVYTDEEINEAINEFKDYDIVLIDTAGRSHKSKEQCDDLERLINSVDEDKREIYLVLSATTKYNDLVRITENYSKITNYRLIFTKLDETISIGNILNIRMLTNADLSYITWGQNVPDDIGKLDTQNTAKQLLGGNK